jgi:Family of unknown function (DUF5681)
VLSERVFVTENGQRKKITKGEAIFKQLVNKGASGDARSIQMLLRQFRSIGADSEPLPSEVGQDRETEQMIMLERLTIPERLELRRLVAKAEVGETGTNEADQSEAIPSSHPANERPSSS